MVVSIFYAMRDDHNTLRTKCDGQLAPLQDAISVRAATLEQALSPVFPWRMSSIQTDPSGRVSGPILALSWRGVRA